ncbi:MAG: crossover junction endodeoxyribonuclease RuvC [Candidatus Puniceispirillales bacterium]
MRVCGIDPGLRHTGWGIVDIAGSSLTWVADGVISPAPDLPDEARLAVIHRDLATMLATHQPDRAAIEEIFVSRSAAAALKLGMARGVALVSLAEAGLPVSPIAARRVKQNITGSGRADKDQVFAMVRRLLGVVPQSVDSADALAIAIAASHDDAAAPADAVSGQGLEAAIARALAKEDAR